MNNFKVKTCKKKEKKTSKENSTIDKKHNDMIKQFAKNKKLIKKLEKQISTITRDLDSWDISKKQKQIDEYIELQDKKIDLEKQLDSIHNSLNEEEYMLDTGKLLFQYYEIKNNKVDNSVTNTESETIINPNQKKTILSFFTNSKEKELNQSKSTINTSNQENERNENLVEQHRAGQKICKEGSYVALAKCNGEEGSLDSMNVLGSFQGDKLSSELAYQCFHWMRAQYGRSDVHVHNVGKSAGSISGVNWIL